MLVLHGGFSATHLLAIRRTFKSSTALLSWNSEQRRIQRIVRTQLVELPIHPKDRPFEMDVRTSFRKIDLLTGKVQIERSFPAQR
jgi:hypothetical protein